MTYATTFNIRTTTHTLYGLLQSLVVVGVSTVVKPGKSMWPLAKHKPAFGLEPIANLMALEEANPKQGIAKDSWNAKPIDLHPTRCLSTPLASLTIWTSLTYPTSTGLMSPWSSAPSLPVQSCDQVYWRHYGTVPGPLRVPGGCNGPWPVFKTEEYRCKSGKCRPTNYSRFFKEMCPNVYSYPKDDKTSVFTCPNGTN
ncbi:hypothetical protein SLE2022_135620 [Rubroshorea leprosula]